MSPFAPNEVIRFRLVIADDSGFPIDFRLDWIARRYFEKSADGTAVLVMPGGTRIRSGEEVTKENAEALMAWFRDVGRRVG